MTEHDTDDGLDDEERDDSRMFRDGLLNGDEKFNRFVKLTDARFGSIARRANKHRKETRDSFSKLETDLAPLIELALFVQTVRKYAAPIGGVIATVGGAILILVSSGVKPWEWF